MKFQSLKLCPMGHYVGIINRRGEAGYVITFPDFAGCMATGKSLEDVVSEGREVLDQHIGDLIHQGLSAPEASSLDLVLSDPRLGAGAPVLVPAPPKASKTVRVSLALPEDALRDIDAHAEASGQTRSDFLVGAARTVMNAERHADKQDAAEAARAEAGRAVIDLWGSGDRRTSSFLARMRAQNNRSHGLLGRTADGRPAPLSGLAQDEFRRFFEQTLKAAEHLQARVAKLEAQPPIAIPRAGNDR